MKLFDTKHKKKSAIETSLILALLVLSFFYVGMTYMDPPEEMGVEVNFGTMDTGSGTIETMQEVKTAPTPTPEPQETQSEPEDIPEEMTESTPEEVITQETEDAPVIPSKPDPVKPKPENKPTPKPKPKPKPKPSQSTTNALDNLISGPANNGTTNQGEGDDSSGGNKGQIDGTAYGNAYFGGGTGNGKGYGLNGRSRKTNPKVIQDCNEEGRVVIKIEVNRQGTVKKADFSVKGTTNSAPCLTKAAIKAAKATRFSAAPNAPETQIGFIIYNFSLGE